MNIGSRFHKSPNAEAEFVPFARAEKISERAEDLKDPPSLGDDMNVQYVNKKLTYQEFCV
jgi:hypothetical protein